MEGLAESYKEGRRGGGVLMSLCWACWGREGKGGRGGAQRADRVFVCLHAKCGLQDVRGEL